MPSGHRLFYREMGLSKPQAGEMLTRLARGIEAGIVGGAAMLVLLIADSLWDGRYWWQFPNLLGSTFYGPRAFRAGAGMATLSGFALHFVITGTLGGIFALAFDGIYQRGRMMLLGILVTVGWYNLANALFWAHVNPWVPAAAPRPATVISYVLLGACLGYAGQRRKLAPPPDLAVEQAQALEPAQVLEPAFVTEHPALAEPAAMNGTVMDQAAHAGETRAPGPGDAIE